MKNEDAAKKYTPQTKKTINKGLILALALLVGVVAFAITNPGNQPKFEESTAQHQSRLLQANITKSANRHFQECRAQLECSKGLTFLGITTATKDTTALASVAR